MKKFDVIVVGAGSAGCVIATRLSEDRTINVALVEAGKDYPRFRDMPDAIKYLGSEKVGPTGNALQGEGRGEFDWGFSAQVADGRTLRLPRGRVIGGTNSVNGVVLLRAPRIDFDAWAAMGNPEWSFDKVLPYYCRVETDLDFQDDYHGTSGPMRLARVRYHNWFPEDHAFEEACLAAGHKRVDDLNNPDEFGFGPAPSGSQDGTRVSTARAYLSMARGRPNLTIIAETTISRVLFHGTRATGVETTSGDVIEGGEVVLSSGALKSPQILTLSGIGHAAHLRSLGIPVISDVPGVGQGLRDHPALLLLWDKQPGAPVNATSPAQQGSPRNSAVLFLTLTAPGSDIPWDVGIKSFGAATLQGLAEADAELSGRYTTVAALNLATSKGEVRTTSTDPNVLPTVDLGHLTTGSDRSRMRSVIRHAVELAEHSSMREFVAGVVEPGPEILDDDDALDAWIRRRVKTGHHMTSTCKLGPDSDDEAVVDQFGRVRGVQGLRVGEGSIMPDCTRPNPNLTTIMIGERIADFVKQGA